jgi:hypothetical protein
MFALLNQSDMKKIRIIVLGIAIIGIFHACGIGQHHTTIVENSGDRYLKIEYAGYVHFYSDGSAISSISPGGYVKYQNNDKELEAKSNDMGGVKYELYEDGQKLSLDANGRRFIADAVREMLKKGHNPGNGRY